jgi:hypothetical protein
MSASSGCSIIASLLKYFLLPPSQYIAGIIVHLAALGEPGQLDQFVMNEAAVGAEASPLVVAIILAVAHGVDQLNVFPGQCADTPGKVIIQDLAPLEIYFAETVSRFQLFVASLVEL